MGESLKKGDWVGWSGHWIYGWSLMNQEKTKSTRHRSQSFLNRIMSEYNNYKLAECVIDCFSIEYTQHFSANLNISSKTLNWQWYSPAIISYIATNNNIKKNFNLTKIYFTMNNSYI